MGWGVGWGVWWVQGEVANRRWRPPCTRAARGQWGFVRLAPGLPKAFESTPPHHHHTPAHTFHHPSRNRTARCPCMLASQQRPSPPAAIQANKCRAQCHAVRHIERTGCYRQANTQTTRPTLHFLSNTVSHSLGDMQVHTLALPPQMPFRVQEGCNKGGAWVGWLVGWWVGGRASWVAGRWWAGGQAAAAGEGWLGVGGGT